MSTVRMNYNSRLVVRKAGSVISTVVDLTWLLFSFHPKWMRARERVFTIPVSDNVTPSIINYELDP